MLNFMYYNPYNSAGLSMVAPNITQTSASNSARSLISMNSSEASQGWDSRIISEASEDLASVYPSQVDRDGFSNWPVTYVSR